MYRDHVSLSSCQLFTYHCSEFINIEMHCGCTTTIPTAMCGGSQPYPPIANQQHHPSSQHQQEEQLRVAAQKYALIREAELKAEAELTHAKSQCATLQATLRERLNEASEIATQTQHAAEDVSNSNANVGEEEGEDDDLISKMDEVTSLATNILAIRKSTHEARLEADNCIASTKVLHKSTEEHTSVKARLTAKRTHLVSHGVAERDALHKDALARGKTTERITKLTEELAALDDRLLSHHASNSRLTEKVAALEESGKRHRVRISTNKAQAAALREKKTKLQSTLKEVEAEKNSISAQRQQAAAKRASSSNHPPSSTPHLGLLQDVLASVQALRRQYEGGTTAPIQSLQS